MIKADVLYIGYPRSGSTYLRAYFRNHPQMNYDDQQIAEILYQPASYKPDLVDPPGYVKDGKGGYTRPVYISCDESICESVCVTGRPEVWGKYLYRPGCFNLVRHDILIDPREAARRMKAIHPNAKVLMVIRNQVDWFESIYKAVITSLPPNQRTFGDYWLCPQGIAMRVAGHHDRVIDAWTKLYDDVLILRHEDLMFVRTSWNLCRWLEVDHVPFPRERINESHAGVTYMHQMFPFLSRSPHAVKSLLKPLTKFIPGKHNAVLTVDDREMIRELYRESNERTESMLNARRMLCLS